MAGASNEITQLVMDALPAVGPKMPKVITTNVLPQPRDGLIIGGGQSYSYLVGLDGRTEDLKNMQPGQEVVFQ